MLYIIVSILIKIHIYINADCIIPYWGKQRYGKSKKIESPKMQSHKIEKENIIKSGLHQQFSISLSIPSILANHSYPDHVHALFHHVPDSFIIFICHWILVILCCLQIVKSLKTRKQQQRKMAEWQNQRETKNTIERGSTFCHQKTG